MKAIEICKDFYENVAYFLLKESFENELPRMAIGLVGHGSECFGFDDKISKDHDFEIGFNIWITKEDDASFGFKLMRFYSKLPKEYKGIKLAEQSAFGSNEKGVQTITDFYSKYTGLDRLPETNEEWISIPEYALAEATNGQVFYDGLGEFSRARDYLKSERPNDVRLKKLASEIFYMCQYGQYNYKRCFLHNEKASASLCLNEFAKHTANAIYLINDVYAPYYKWLFKGLENLDVLSDVKKDLEDLVSNPFDVENNVKKIDQIALKIEDKLREKGLSEQTGIYLEPYSYCINNKIKDPSLRNSPVML